MKKLYVVFALVFGLVAVLYVRQRPKDVQSTPDFRASPGTIEQNQVSIETVALEEILEAPKAPVKDLQKKPGTSESLRLKAIDLFDKKTKAALTSCVGTAHTEGAKHLSEVWNRLLLSKKIDTKRFTLEWVNQHILVGKETRVVRVVRSETGGRSPWELSYFAFDSDHLPIPLDLPSGAKDSDPLAVARALLSRGKKIKIEAAYSVPDLNHGLVTYVNNQVIDLQLQTENGRFLECGRTSGDYGVSCSCQ